MSAPAGPVLPPGVTQEVVELTFGPLVTGIWLQQLLFGFLVAQFVDYYRQQYNGDSKFNKIIVHSLVGLNLFIGAQDFHVLYRASVLYYGIYEYFDLQEWTMWTEPGFTALVGLAAQLFFLHRCYAISKNKPVLAFLTALVLFSLGAGLAVSGSFIREKRFSLLGQFTTAITLWLVSTSVADIAIAAVLVTHLLQSRTAFKRTNNVIVRLIIMAMETSALTAIVATLNLVLFLPLQNTAYHLLPQFSMSRVYTLTVMATLLARTDLRSAMNSTGHASITTGLREQTTGGLRVGVQKTVETSGPNDVESQVELSDRTESWSDKKTLPPL